MSRTFVQGSGVPQSTVLSCSRFIRKMNTLHSYIALIMFHCTYVDDMEIGFKSYNRNVWAASSTWFE